MALASDMQFFGELIRWRHCDFGLGFGQRGNARSLFGARVGFRGFDDGDRYRVEFNVVEIQLTAFGIEERKDHFEHGMAACGDFESLSAALPFRGMCR